MVVLLVESRHMTLRFSVSFLLNSIAHKLYKVFERIKGIKLIVHPLIYVHKDLKKGLIFL